MRFFQRHISLHTCPDLQFLNAGENRSRIPRNLVETAGAVFPIASFIKNVDVEDKGAQTLKLWRGARNEEIR